MAKRTIAFVGLGLLTVLFLATQIFILPYYLERVYPHPKLREYLNKSQELAEWSKRQSDWRLKHKTGIEKRHNETYLAGKNESLLGVFNTVQILRARYLQIPRVERTQATLYQLRNDLFKIHTLSTECIEGICSFSGPLIELNDIDHLEQLLQGNEKEIHGDPDDPPGLSSAPITVEPGDTELTMVPAGLQRAASIVTWSVSVLLILLTLLVCFWNRMTGWFRRSAQKTGTSDSRSPYRSATICPSCGQTYKTL